MEKFVILVQDRQGSEVRGIKEIYCGEEKAVRICMNIFRDCGMQKVILVDREINVRFKDTRICKCMNVQKEFFVSGGEPMEVNKCMGCGVVINYDGWMSDVDMDEQLEGSL